MSVEAGGSWVIFLEDPGAVNAIAPLVETLARQKVVFKLFADGQAMRLMRERGFDPFQLRSSDGTFDHAINPSSELLIVGTSENPKSKGFDLTTIARKMGVPSVAIIDAAVNAVHRFRGNSSEPLAYAPDWLLVPDQWTADKYVELGFAQDRVAVVGDPNVDRLRDVLIEFQQTGRETVRENVFPSVARKQKVLTFISEVSTGLAPEQYQRSAEYTLCGRGAATARTEIVVEEILDAIKQLVDEGLPRPYLVLRRHPKETALDLGNLVSSFDMLSVGGDPLSVVFGSDIVVGMSSMLLAEAHFLGVPCLAVLPRELERDWLSELRNRSIQSVTRRRELLKAMRTLLSRGLEHSNDSEYIPVPRVRVVNRCLEILRAIVK
jgi:hypothetical protein